MSHVEQVIAKRVVQAPTTDDTKLLDSLTGYTPGPWTVFEYDAGDKPGWNNCPSIQAAEEYDCAIVHWDGFKQRHWQSARGQHEIDANATLIAAAPELRRIALDRGAEIARLEEALEFYAPKIVNGIPFVGGDDGGQRARAALDAKNNQNTKQKE